MKSMNKKNISTKTLEEQYAKIQLSFIDKIQLSDSIYNSDINFISGVDLAYWKKMIKTTLFAV